MPHVGILADTERRDWEEEFKEVTASDLGAKRALNVSGISCATVTDSSSTANTTYIGNAPVGSETSASAWQIFRVVTSGNDVTVTYADGDANFDNIWDDRTGLSYS